MNTIWIALAVLALILAVQAVNRVRSKRQLPNLSTSAQPNEGTISGQPARQAAAPQSGSSFDQGGSEAAQPQVTIPIPLAPDELQPDTDMPLAATLSVNQLVHPESNQAAVIPDLVSSESATAEAATPSVDTQTQRTVLEEIARLGQGSETAISHFSHYLDHPDSTIRAAAVFELGELISKQQSADEGIVERLHQLSQDTNSQVRSQAVAALSKIEAPIPALRPDSNSIA